MLTSSAPTPAPKTNRLIIRPGKLDSVARKGNAKLKIKVDAVITTRHPSFAVSAPATGIAMIEPVPRDSSSRPNMPSSICARALANGTRGAQAATPIPAMKKTMRVEICWMRPGVVGSVLMIGFICWMRPDVEGSLVMIGFMDYWNCCLSGKWPKDSICDILMDREPHALQSLDQLRINIILDDQVIDVIKTRDLKRGRRLQFVRGDGCGHDIALLDQHSLELNFFEVESVQSAFGRDRTDSEKAQVD